MSNQENNSNAGNNNVNVINKNVNKAHASGGARTTGAAKNAQGAKNSGSNVQNDVSNAVSFCKRNLRYIAAGGLFLAVVVFLLKSSAGSAGNAEKEPGCGRDRVGSHGNRERGGLRGRCVSPDQ